MGPRRAPIEKSQCPLDFFEKYRLLHTVRKLRHSLVSCKKPFGKIPLLSFPLIFSRNKKILPLLFSPHIIFFLPAIFVPIFQVEIQRVSLFFTHGILFPSWGFILSQGFSPFPPIISLLAKLFLHEVFFQLLFSSKLFAVFL